MDPMNVKTLRPGILVSLKTSIRGNVSYKTQDIEGDHIDENGSRVAVWETERRIDDPIEHEEAVKLRGKARALITAVCSTSSFGLLCADDNAQKLKGAIEEAQAIAAEFNTRAKLTRISVFVIGGRIAQDDVQAVRAINSEVRDLLSDMESGLKDLDVQKVRDAANKAKNLGQMLSEDAAERVKVAIEAARFAAKRIVKAGELASEEIDRTTMRILRRSRTAFLDLTDAGEEIAKPTVHARALDLPVEPVAMGRMRLAPARELELTE